MAGRFHQARIMVRYKGPTDIDYRFMPVEALANDNIAIHRDVFAENYGTPHGEPHFALTDRMTGNRIAVCRSQGVAKRVAEVMTRQMYPCVLLGRMAGYALAIKTRYRAAVRELKLYEGIDIWT
jgi:hypothetical protein